MEDKELKKITIKNYMEYLDEEDLEDNIESIDQYISTLWYDLIDEIEINKEMFGIELEVDDYEAGEMIENMTKEILLNKGVMICG